MHERVCLIVLTIFTLTSLSAVDDAIPFGVREEDSIVPPLILSAWKETIHRAIKENNPDIIHTLRATYNLDEKPWRLALLLSPCDQIGSTALHLAVQARVGSESTNAELITAIKTILGSEITAIRSSNGTSLRYADALLAILLVKNTAGDSPITIANTGTSALCPVLAENARLVYRYLIQEAAHAAEPSSPAPDAISEPHDTPPSSSCTIS